MITKYGNGIWLSQNNQSFRIFYPPKHDCFYFRWGRLRMRFFHMMG